MKTWEKLRQNPDLISRYLVREKVIDTIRSFFKSNGFHEVSTPILVATPSAEPNLEVFETQLRTATHLSRRAFLILSPEYSLKKLLAAGLGNIFEITKCFRNEEDVSEQHNPEFSMLEWYRTGSDYQKIMEDFEQMFVEIIKTVQPESHISAWEYQGEKYDLTSPWPRISVAESFEKYAHIDTDTLLSQEKLKTVYIEKGYRTEGEEDWEQMFYQIFFNEIEPQLKAMKKPVFVYDYPLSQAALARKKASDPRFAERFEVYLAGLELGNCFSELTDAAEQEARLEADVENRKRQAKTEYPVDRSFIDALKSGIPESAGIAVGVDRLVMLAANTTSIQETLFFPASEVFDLT